MTKDLEKMLQEMKNAQAMIGFWLKGSPINTMLLEWMKTTEKYIAIFKKSLSA